MFISLNIAGIVLEYFLLVRGAFSYDATKENVIFLFFFTYSLAGVYLKFRTFSLLLNKTVYTAVRETIKAKLGKGTDNFISALDM